MREQLNKKFEGIKHKWISFPVKSNEFHLVLDRITVGIKENEITKDNAVHLVKSFKENDIVFLKYKNPIGRSNVLASCEIIDKDNTKLQIKLKPATVITASILEGTPKSLKLYKRHSKKNGDWKKPNDGFVDPVQYPPVEEELTELGYKMYKDWHSEIKASGMTRDEYVKKLFNIPFFTKARI